VGKRRLEKAISIVGGESDFPYRVVVKWHPFFLDPSLPTEGIDKMEAYDKKFGKDRIARMIPHMTQVGKQDGISFSFGGKVANTMRSHRLLELARRQARAEGDVRESKVDRCAEALFRAYFENEESPGDPDVLLRAASEAGVDDVNLSFVEGSECESEVRREIRKYQGGLGIRGVPYFIINEEYQLSGAQEPEAFVDIFREIASNK